MPTVRKPVNTPVTGKRSCVGGRKTWNFCGYSCISASSPPTRWQAEDGDQDAGGEQQADLEEVGPRGRGQAAVDRVRAGGDAEEDDRPRQVHVEHALQRQPAGVERAAEDRGDVTDDQREREDVAAGAVVAPLEELRHRVDAAAHVVREEDPDQQRVDDPRVPAPRAERRCRTGTRRRRWRSGRRWRCRRRSCSWRRRTTAAVLSPRK